jgi:PAS domain S-box-containing protein
MTRLMIGGTWPDAILSEGEMGRLTRQFDWRYTSLGPIEFWPESLQTLTRAVLESSFPMIISWGPDNITLYNDRMAAIIGQKHPFILGKSMKQAFPEFWELHTEPNIRKVYQTGKSVLLDDACYPLIRSGYVEELYSLIGYSPLFNDEGEIRGVLITVTETVEKVIDARRLKTIQNVTSYISKARDCLEVCRLTAEELKNSTLDIPFALIYLLDEGCQTARLASITGIEEGQQYSPAIIELNDPEAPWPLDKAITSGPQYIANLEQQFGPLPGGIWPEPAREALISPIVIRQENSAVGFLIAGISPRRPFNDKYRDFLQFLTSQVAAAIATVQAYEQERKRAQELAELDRAKTAFFSSVSHEFRTPVTLILGPIEEALSEVEVADPFLQRERLQTVQRNTLRLLKLVNQLLDFSAIEANRMQAIYRPTDLSSLTVDLASMFRSAIEKAGISLIVDCPPLSEPVYVDRDMWEKIVLNLLSNAFKHTFEGQIRVTLRQQDRDIIFSVKDSGIGIPSKHLPHLFERFYRIPQARSRTHEGTGIGLALVQALVELHEGSISVDSVIDQGTTFTVTIPVGKAHLPMDLIQEETVSQTAPRRAQPFIDEALSWLHQPKIESEKDTLEEVAWYKTSTGDKVRILLAEDNIDMRNYITRLLAYYCEVESVPDGYAALMAARRHRPDLILSDIMMPKMDGLQLLSTLQNDPSLKTIPVVLLSARAGEESSVEGLQLGAADYLVKPFDKRELLARVKANLNLELHRITQEAEEARRLSEARFRRLVNSNIIGIFSGKLHDGRITEANDYMLNMLGYSRSELEEGDLNWKWLTPPEYAELDESRVTESLEKGYLTPFEKQYFHKDGHRVDIMIGVAVLENAQDDFICYVLDISPQKQAEAKLRDYMQRLEQSNKELEHFAAIASHDLQEPLRKVLLFSDHLQKTERQVLSLEGLDDLKRIQRAIYKMQHLITDLLDLSRITRKGKPFHKMELATTANEVIAELSYSYPDIRKRVKTSGSMVIEADTAQIHQMLSQLLDNSLKFHKPGNPSQVTIHIQPVETNQCQITLVDNGIGIKSEHLDRIFDIFTRFHSESDYSGTGIGLALVRKIVERHHGQIQVQSIPNQGSQFTILLPVTHS